MTKTCTSEEITSAKKSFTYDIPSEGEQIRSFPASSTNYVSAPIDGCAQSFSYEMIDGSANPIELTIDPTTGTFALTDKAS